MDAGNGKAEVKPPRKAGLSLFERVTGVALGERRAERKERAARTMPFDAVASESTESSEVKPIPASIEGDSDAPELRSTVGGESAKSQANLSSSETTTAETSPALVDGEQTGVKSFSEREPDSPRLSVGVPEAKFQSEPQVNTILGPSSEQVSQPEIVSNTVPVVSSESIQGPSLEKDAAADIEEPTFIDDLPAESILSNPREEEDLLDIPAFLRRQAN